MLAKIRFFAATLLMLCPWTLGKRNRRICQRRLPRTAPESLPSPTLTTTANRTLRWFALATQA